MSNNMINLCIFGGLAACLAIYMTIIAPRQEDKRIAKRRNERCHRIENLRKLGFQQPDSVNIVRTSGGWRRVGNVTHVPFKQDQN